MKKLELVGLVEKLGLNGKNTKKILNNYLFFLAENGVNVLNIQENSKHLNIKYKTKTGKKCYLLHIDNTLLKSNKTLITIS